MKHTPEHSDGASLEMLVTAAGLASAWQRWPDEVKAAQALAATYVNMLPAEPDAQIAPWVFPQMSARDES